MTERFSPSLRAPVNDSSTLQLINFSHELHDFNGSNPQRRITKSLRSLHFQHFSIYKLIFTWRSPGGKKKKKGQLHVLKTTPLLLSRYMVIYTETPSKKSTLQLWWGTFQGFICMLFSTKKAGRLYMGDNVTLYHPNIIYQLNFQIQLISVFSENVLTLNYEYSYCGWCLVENQAA